MRNLLVFLLGLASCAHMPYASFKDWQVVGSSNWSINNREVVGVATNQGGFLVSPGRVGPMHLSIEFMADPEVNSGIFVACEDRLSVNPLTCFEINIWDNHPNQKYRTGAIVTHAEPKAIVETLGRWNRYDIYLSHQELLVELNGVEVAQLASPLKDSGYVALQAKRQTSVRFRNLRIQALEKSAR